MKIKPNQIYIDHNGDLVLIKEHSGFREKWWRVVIGDDNGNTFEPLYDEGTLLLNCTKIGDL
jgi:hypothetical protein